ncbi:MAG: 50S ribosomal protein L6 [bacterium]|nr:50S ribosomal protein L6 [bacterium]
MSRIGKQPIPVPAGTTITVDGPMVSAQGPKGKLTTLLHPLVGVSVVDGIVSVSVKNPENHKQAALWGVFRSLIANMVRGVTEGFTKQLEISGIGFKAAISGSTMTLHVGYSHPVTYQVPAGVAVTVDKNIITVAGTDKQQIGQVAAEIRDIMPPEPYKGKGIKYVGEVIRRKAGKQATKTE